MTPGTCISDQHDDFPPDLRVPKESLAYIRQAILRKSTDARRELSIILRQNRSMPRLCIS
jgi:hypothetical protein